jgi:hypothetical protein
MNNLYLYEYRWGNNIIRAKLKGKKCRILARGKMNTCMIEFEDGERHTISLNALRKL